MASRRSEWLSRIRASRSTTLAWTSAGWIGFVVVTERWRPWGDAVRLQYATDVEEYETIARAAPGFPATRIQTPHADRFPIHWLVGMAHDVARIGLHPLYIAGTLLVIVATLAIVSATVRMLDPDVATYAVAFGAVVASAYPMRYLLDAPGMLTDATFVLGLALLVYAFQTGRFGLVLLGVVLAVLGRQTGLPLAGVAAAAVLIEPRWRRRWPAAASILAVAAVVYFVPHRLSASFADTSGRGIVGVSLAGGSWTSRELASHIGRSLIAVAVPAALLALGWLRGRARPLWVPLALGGCVFAQALALAPDWSHAEPRLAGLALPALVVAAVPSLKAARLGVREALLVATGIALASAHHLYSNLGVTRTSEWGALVALGCLLVVAPVATRGR